jgi:hypothetical protein
MPLPEGWRLARAASWLGTRNGNSSLSCEGWRVFGAVAFRFSVQSENGGRIRAQCSSAMIQIEGVPLRRRRYGR